MDGADGTSENVGGKMMSIEAKRQRSRCVPGADCTRRVVAALTNSTKMDPLKPVRMATLAVYWWVIRLPTLLLCYRRILFTHFDALNEKPHCDPPYAAV